MNIYSYNLNYRIYKLLNFKTNSILNKPWFSIIREYRNIPINPVL